MQIDNDKRIERNEQYWQECEKFIKRSSVFVEDVHHIIPISLRGHDLKHNREYIRQPLHRHIHFVLDIRRNLYSELTRQQKKKFNHKVIVSPWEVEEVANIQKMYFMNLHKLSDWVVEIHERKMFETLKYREDVASNFITFDVVDDKLEFHKLHTLTIDLQKRIAEELQTNVKKLYFNI